MPIKLNTASGGGVILQGANTASDKTITIPADDGTMIYANSSGNVGIGTSTPGVPFQLRTNPASAANIMAQINPNTSTNAASLNFNNGGSGSVYVGRASSAGTGPGGATISAYDTFFWNSGAQNIVFGTNDAERIRLDTSGNVGIGTTSPTAYSGYSTLALNGSNGGVIEFQQGGIQKSRITNAGDAVLQFVTNGAERARIDPSGNLLVGTTTDGGDGLSFRPRVSGGGTTQIAFNRASSSTTGDAVAFNNGGSRVGTITYNNTSTAYLTSSDYRLKENVQPMTGALAKLAALKPCTYTWKADGSNGEGFIAHELAEICPHAVTGEKDAVNEDGSIKPQGIDTSFLVATLTAAIQELKAEVDSLRAQVEAK